MDNSQNQFQKNVYQVPASQSGESLNTSGASVEAAPSTTVNQKFEAIAREYVRDTFNQMTQDLEMSLSGYEVREQPPVEISSQDFTAIEILQVGEGMKAHRSNHRETLMESARTKRIFGRIIAALVAKQPTEALQPTLDKVIDHESRIGATLFPKDPEVLDLKFFFLPGVDIETGTEVDMWHHHQTSLVPSKNYTNTYKITESGIKKSSTFVDERLARTVNMSSIPSEVETYNLLIASKKYYAAVTEKVYLKKAAPRFSFGSKSDHDLAA